MSVPITERGPSTVSAWLTSCPGCGEIEGVEQTSSTPRVAAWKCTRCRMAWAVSVVNPHLRPALADLAAAAEEIARLRWRLAQVIAVADDAPGLTDRELRDRLLALAESCAR